MRAHATRGILCVLVLFAATPALAESDWFASLYTGEGTELRADERVFTLFALMNAMGYDDGKVARQHPLPRYDFHPVRKEIRQKLLAADPEVRKQADTFFDNHPQPLGRYLQYALRTEPPPFKAGPKGKEFADLKGLEALLQSAYTRWNLGELQAQVQAEYRKALKAYLNAIDAPMARARQLLKVKDGAPPSLLVVNLLEAEGRATGHLTDSEVILVVGPSPTPNVEGVVRAYGQAQLDPWLTRKAQGGWAGGQALLREARGYGATEGTVGEYATALLSRALALRAIQAPDSAYEAAASQGYFGLKDIGRMFDDAKPVEAWAMDALARAEARRPAGKR